MSTQTAEQKILEQIGLFREDFRVFRTELLGGADEDKPNGRIPLLEAFAVRQAETNEDHNKRIRRLEHFVVMLFGAAALLKALSWSAESLYHVVSVFHHS